ncbi:MAG: hypothetical protein ACLTGT_06610 [Oscillospiraceae bacterium]
MTDPDVEVTVEPAETAHAAYGRRSTRRAVCLLVCHPNGVQVMSADIPGLVQTSLNMGILTTGETAVHLSSSVRSSVESQKQMLLQRIACLTAELGGETSTRGEYPGWAYLPDSPLRDLMVEVFTDQYGYEPKVEAIHAGLECVPLPAGAGLCPSDRSEGRSTPSGRKCPSPPCSGSGRCWWSCCAA